MKTIETSLTHTNSIENNQVRTGFEQEHNYIAPKRENFWSRYLHNILMTLETFLEDSKWHPQLIITGNRTLVNRRRIKSPLKHLRGLFLPKQFMVFSR